MHISQAEAELITRYLDIDAPSDYADLLFVFGNSLQRPARLAAEIMAANRAKFVVLTGGIHKRRGFNEAEAHLKILLDCGIDPERIMVENESTNTRENVLFALPQIMKRVDLDSIQSVMVLASWHHCRRATMTLKRHLPDGTRYSNVTYEVGSVTRDGWWNSAEGCKEVMASLAALEGYLKRDHIAEIQEVGGFYV